MATDDAPALWMLSGTGIKGGDSYFSSTTQCTRSDHPQDLKVEWDHPALDDVLGEGQARLTVTGWDRTAVFREYSQMWTGRLAEEDRARRAVLVAQADARKAARKATRPATYRRWR